MSQPDELELVSPKNKTTGLISLSGFLPKVIRIIFWKQDLTIYTFTSYNLFDKNSSPFKIVSCVLSTVCDVNSLSESEKFSTS